MFRLRSLSAAFPLGVTVEFHEFRGDRIMPAKLARPSTV
jgi:hypothetical protein